jgi:hypothetical protein
LTKTELANTVRDLFGVSTAPIVALPDEHLGASGFDTDAQTLDMSSQLLDQLFTATGAVAADAVAHSSFLTCQPGAQQSDIACARATLEAKLPLLFRRPVTADEVSDLLAVYQSNQAAGFTSAMQLVLQAALLSPSFLYLTYAQSPNPSDTYSLNDYELASRLSYFLWSSTPDTELRGTAQAGTLSKPEVLQAQTRRMLADPKAVAFIDALGSQWLGLSQLTTALRDPAVYPAWSPALRDAMIQETKAFFRSFLTEDKNLPELLTADYSFLDPTLASHYGIAGVTGQAQKVALPEGSHRTGLLTQGSFLALTSTAERSNPIRRGKWVILQVLCTDLPPRPANVAPIPDTPAAETDVRGELAAHRTNPACAGCHSMMDPIGLGLENYDAIGAYRKTYRDGSPIDPSGELPGGATFKDVPGLVRDLLANGTFNRCITRKVLAYALGRDLSMEDRCTSDQVAAAAVSPQKKLSDLVLAIAASTVFRQREGVTP